jgi:hypothetical protein
VRGCGQCGGGKGERRKGPKQERGGKEESDELKKTMVKHASVPPMNQIDEPRVPSEKVEMVQLAENLSK